MPHEYYNPKQTRTFCYLQLHQHGQRNGRLHGNATQERFDLLDNWLSHFVKCMQAKRINTCLENWHLLILDGHKFYVIVDVIMQPCKVGLDFLTLPSHMNHVLKVLKVHSDIAMIYGCLLTWIDVFETRIGSICVDTTLESIDIIQHYYHIPNCRYLAIWSNKDEQRSWLRVKAIHHHKN